MKHIFLSFVILSVIIYPLLFLTSCTKEEMKSKEITRQEIPAVVETPELDIDEIEAQAERARQQLIESIKETSSRPDVVRGLGGNNVNLNATEMSSGADEKQ